MRRISPTISFFSLLASRRELHLLMLCTNDSKCRAPVREVISSVRRILGREEDIERLCRAEPDVPSCESRMLRTLEISFLRTVSVSFYVKVFLLIRRLLLPNSSTRL